MSISVGRIVSNVFQAWLDRKKRIPFHLLDNDLFNFVFLKFNENESGYYMIIHHIAADGWSCFLLFQEINEIYEALEAGQSIDDVPGHSYLQYIADEQTYLKSQQAKEDKEFWHHTFYLSGTSKPVT